MCEELLAGFVRFVDFLNHIKRGHSAERARRINTVRGVADEGVVRSDVP